MLALYEDDRKRAQRMEQEIEALKDTIQNWNGRSASNSHTSEMSQDEDNTEEARYNREVQNQMAEDDAIINGNQPRSPSVARPLTHLPEPSAQEREKGKRSATRARELGTEMPESQNKVGVLEEDPIEHYADDPLQNRLAGGNRPPLEVTKATQYGKPKSPAKTSPKPASPGPNFPTLAVRNNNKKERSQPKTLPKVNGATPKAKAQPSSGPVSGGKAASAKQSDNH